MEKLLIGIDISKDSFDYCMLTGSNRIHEKGNLANNTKQIEKFCVRLNKLKTEFDLWVCMEHTGYYGYLLATVFSGKGIRYSLLSPLDLKLSQGLQRGKNDAIDAYRIASYGLSNYHKLSPHKLAEKEMQTLKVLMTQREELIKISVQLQNTLKGLKIASKSVDVSFVIEQTERLIDNIKGEIRDLEKLMLSVVKENKEMAKSFEKITRIIGVGPITALSCIIETKNFTSFKNARKFACHCGLAPFEYQSGSSIKGRSRTSHLCKRSMKAVLFKAACNAIQHDKQLKSYYNRKVSEGKHKLGVINAVANKLILRIFAVQKREAPFLPMNA